MKVLTFAAGVAVGYVLGTRAGREKYEEIAAGARKLAGHPAVTDAQAKLKDLVDAGTQAVTAKVDEVAETLTEKIMPERTRPAATTNGAVAGR